MQLGTAFLIRKGGVMVTFISKHLKQQLLIEQRQAEKESKKERKRKRKGKKKKELTSLNNNAN